MGWRVEIDPRVRQGVNALCFSGALSRAGMILAYNSLWLELPRQARRARQNRDPADPNYFRYPVRVYDGGVWHHFTFAVQDKAERNLLYVDDLTHKTGP